MALLLKSYFWWAGDCVAAASHLSSSPLLQHLHPKDLQKPPLGKQLEAPTLLVEAIHKAVETVYAGPPAPLTL